MKFSWLKIILGTFFYTGFAPFAPATFTSLFALSLPYLLQGFPFYYIIITILTLFGGVQIATDLERIWGKDARRITIDEVLGILITFLFIHPINWKVLLVGFLLFRFFDIIKLPFIKRAQRIEGGWGVMLDDLMSGIISNIGLRIILHVSRFTYD